MVKVMTLLGTRPEIIKMSRVLSECDRQFNHVFVHSGQNYDYELNQIFFDELGIRKPDYFLEAAGETPIKSIALTLDRFDDVLRKEEPEALLLYGDTNTTLAVIAAKRAKVPVFHMEAGNRCFDERVPEELNRKVLDHLSDINLVLTEHARRYLIAEGIRPETIIKTGSHMGEVLDYYMPQIHSSAVLSREHLDEGAYFLVSAHREENVDSKERLNDLLASLREIAAEYGQPVVVSTHPRTRKRLEEMGGIEANENIRFCKPFGFFDFVRLQMGARCVLSDSGTITEEASILNLPAITLRNAHERPEGMDAGTLIMSGLKPQGVMSALRVILSQNETDERVAPLVDDYRTTLVSKQVVRVVLSYIGYINHCVWRK